MENKNAAPPPQKAPPQFHTRETKLCAELGVSKDELRRRRQYFLTQGRHWEYVDKRVLFSSIGLEVMRATAPLEVPQDFEKDRAAADSESSKAIKGLLLEKNAPPLKFDGRLIVWATPSKNSKILIAHLPGTDPTNPLNLVTVFVRDNKNFLRGMVMPGAGRQVRQVGEYSFELLGAPPRYRGRW